MRNSPNTKIAIIAHRGASGSAPENTIAAIQLALKMEADMIEIDVHLSKDGIPVIIHDETLNRTTNGKGEVKNFNVEDLKKLDAGKWFSDKYIGEKIPTLEEVITLIKGKCILLIEIKHGSSIYPNIEKTVLEIIHDKKAEKECIIQSFECEVLDNLRKLNCPVEIQKLVTGNVPFLPLHIDSKLKFGSIYQYQKVSAINPNFKFVNTNAVNKIHASGKKIFTWTVNEEQEMKRMIEYGVDGIITNFPEKLKAILHP